MYRKVDSIMKNTPFDILVYARCANEVLMLINVMNDLNRNLISLHE